LRGLTPPGRPEHKFTYTLRGELAASTPPPVGAVDTETRFTYDADGKSTRVDHPGGGAVQFQYAGGTCQLNTVNLGSRQRTYGYDAAGRLVSLGSSQAISLAVTYDGQLPTAATWSGAVTGSVTQSYDSEWRVASFRINGADHVAIAYDADDLPAQVGALVLTRSPSTGVVTGSTLGGISDLTTYDAFGALMNYTSSHNGSAVYVAAFARDLLGRLTQKSETVGGVTRVIEYTYDVAGRLTEVRYDGVLTSSYTYDANGNRLSRSDSNGTLNATYDNQDRLNANGPTTYSYNLKGERVTKVAASQTTTYEYEGMGNLTGVNLPNGTQIEYLLDALDRRVGRKVNGTFVHAFLYHDRLRPIAELDSAGAVVSRFVYATNTNVPDYMVKAGVTYRIITDDLGSPRLVIDVTTGQVAQRMEHDEFGRVTLDSNPGFQPFGFAGGLYDPQTGLVHFGAREYDPETGRWTIKDPIGFSGGDGNLYAYVANDPVNYFDPSGLCLTTVDCTCVRQPGTCAAAGITAKAAAAAAPVAAVATPVATAVAFAAPHLQGAAPAVNAVSNAICRASTIPAMAPDAIRNSVNALAQTAPAAARLNQTVPSIVPQVSRVASGLSPDWIQGMRWFSERLGTSQYASVVGPFTVREARSDAVALQNDGCSVFPTWAVTL
jgi:RHS repeat-associated protein